jgi:hypothetical protein
MRLASPTSRSAGHGGHAQAPARQLTAHPSRQRVCRRAILFRVAGSRNGFTETRNSAFIKPVKTKAMAETNRARFVQALSQINS